MILPFSSSSILESVYDTVDLPAPVLPTIPTFIPFSTVNERSLNTSSVVGRYLSEIFLNSNLPSVGQLGNGFVGWSASIFSYTRSSNSKIF